ncbi:hypothetical protein [Bradyrhizobium sp. AUGA SZCCT0283]|uniref:hypothetical protein n=1 Tax=Bradyrhizobium sp. AUGA SZCCT0283 TaxID=2807671 RepID=UPI001BADB731|nr:hypothetical protein [Bradyrhizobium sp. AUGA SZCCT0283]MBR1279772.1 hypothetical protein [Bradyrhizobium sp. AUGA SZCCT0283]
MEVRSGSFSYVRIRDTGPQIHERTFNFNSPVNQAVAILTGTNFGFSPRNDHHLGLVSVRLDRIIDDDVVTVTGTFGVRDWSDEWDDDYEGTIQFLLLADLETGAQPSNLSITGIEFNQATQFFRSQLHLDPANARPDNSIPMIGAKNTLVRLYVDTQNDPTRPTIASVSGILEIRPGGSANWTSLNPLNAPIPPIQDGAIRRVNANHTLNFKISGPFSAGRLDYRVRAFDASHPGQPGFTSGRTQGSLQFTNVAPLRLRGVGVRYTGNDSMGNPTDIPAPTIVDLRNTLSFTTKTYPVGQVFISGFDTITYDGDFTDKSGDGCGDGWDGLLDRLRDMQGDSDDVYFGIIADSVPRGWGGCGGGDGRVAAAPVGGTRTTAQEVAHAFDRDHAPCPPAGQPNAPDNIDDNYPVYNAFMSGSIGEYGISDGGLVQDPATTADFMSYCSSRWVSPYTYLGLLGNFPIVFSSTFSLSRSPQEDEENLRLIEQHMFLKFRIYRSGEVMVAPSFHYESRNIERKGKWTPYGIELRDERDHVLVSRRVWLLDRHKDLDSAWVDFTKQLPFPQNTTFIVFTCGKAGDCAQKELHRVKVPPNSPRVSVTSPGKSDELSGKVKVAWQVQPRNRAVFTSLVRYSNDAGRTWQAVAPRTQARSLEVDLDRLPGGETCIFQVLVTSGIRTAMAVSEPFRVPRKEIEVTLSAPETGTVVTMGERSIVVGEAFSPDLGSVRPKDLEWTSDVQGNLGSGNELDLDQLRPGRHTITLSAPGADKTKRSAKIQIEVREPKPRTHTSRTHPGHRSADHDAGRIRDEPKGD